MSALWVVPSIDREWGAANLATLRVQRVLRIDNSIANLGVAASWNIGIRAADGMGVDYLVLCSEAVRFGPAGGRDFEEALSGPFVRSTCQGFHLVGISLDMLRAVGYFDPIFLPAYYEDTDWLYRAGIANWFFRDAPSSLPGICGRVNVDCGEAGVAHSITAELATVDLARNAERYRQKWGGDQGSERFRCPYDDETLPWTFIGDYPCASD